MSRSSIPFPAASANPVAGHVLFPFYYLALIIVSGLDLSFTYTIVFILEGIEVNPIANAVLQSPVSFNGLIVFKFLVVVAVIGICEFIGRHNPGTARRLSGWAIGISAFPVVWSALLLLEHF